MLAIKPYPIIIGANFIITFLLFPSLTIDKKFDDISTVWSSLIFVTAYNVGDTIGKMVGGKRQLFNPLSVKFLYICRCFFFFTISIMANGTSDNDPLINNNIFPFVNQFLFSFVNGFIVSKIYFKVRC